SSGNVGNALSAYCAKAGHDAFIWVSSDTAESKRQQISVYGATLFLVPPPVKGQVRNYWRIFTELQAFCEARAMVPMISARPVNPFMVEGTKTISFEIAATLGAVPDDVFCCVGGGGLLGGMSKGFNELIGLGQSARRPRLHGAQRSDRHYAPIDRIADDHYVNGDYFLPLDGEWAWSAIQESGGTLASLNGDEIAEAQSWLAHLEGIFAEPQGAYAAAGLMRAARDGALDPEATIVCIITGVGLKDMGAARRFAEFVAQPEPKLVRGLADAFA
ncbi:MAG TPA: pyridoxal-phosphate dependent enzyme, partial [Nordella sp.]|nr:pyridoxal-phosphate dependent enzyme [Nordella sp.]